MTDLQHFWNNPQAQHLFQQITAQRNFETHQTGLCLTQGQYISITPPGPPAHNYPPPTQPSSHLLHPDSHYPAPSTHGPYNHVQSWQWPSQPQHPSPSPQTPTLDWNHPQGSSYSPTSPQYLPAPRTLFGPQTTLSGTTLPIRYTRTGRCPMPVSRT